MSAAAILAPGIGAAMNYHTIKRIACALVKDINYTLQALSAIGTEMNQIREATLENRVAIDYLLLRHNHGCEEFKEICYFNLSDNSQFVEKKIQQLQDLASEFKDQEGLDFSWLLSWLLNLNGLKQLFLFAILIVHLIIITCCLIQHMLLCRPGTYKGMV